MGFVNELHTKDKFDPLLHNLWEKDNTIVLLWIMSSISKDLLSYVVYAFNVSTVWNDLKERFEKENRSKVFLLHKEIPALENGTQSISTYFTELKDLWVEFDSLMPCPGCKYA